MSFAQGKAKNQLGIQQNKYKITFSQNFSGGECPPELAPPCKHTSQLAPTTLLYCSAGMLSTCALIIFAVVESYESSDNHTYIPMSITALTVIVLLLSLMVLYKILAPTSIQTEVSDLTNASINVSATLAILFGYDYNAHLI